MSNFKKLRGMKTKIEVKARELIISLEDNEFRTVLFEEKLFEIAEKFGLRNFYLMFFKKNYGIDEEKLVMRILNKMNINLESSRERQWDDFIRFLQIVTKESLKIISYKEKIFIGDIFDVDFIREIMQFSHKDF
jgi:hypothetical protein